MTSPRGQLAVASARTPSWTTSASTWAAAATAAPIAVSARLRVRRGASVGRAATSGRSRSTAKSTPPTATAWPHRASPRKSTSTKPATGVSGAPPRAHPQDQKEEGRRADRRQHQEPVGLPERRKRDDQIDEVAVRERLR